MAKERAPYAPSLTVNNKAEVTDKKSETSPSYTKNIRIRGMAKFRDETQNKKGQIAIDVTNETDIQNRQYRKVWGEAPTNWNKETGEWYYDKPAEVGKKYLFELRASIGEAWAELDNVKVEGSIWHEPVDNPQINKYNYSGNVKAQSATYGDVRQNSDGSKKYHSGLDLFALPGTKVYACLDGTIAGYSSNADGSAGITLRIKIDSTSEFLNRMKEVGYTKQFTAEEMGTDIKETDSVYLIYMHLKESLYIQNDVKVRAGTHIGYSGVTGSTATGTQAPHLHFEIATVLDAYGKGKSVRTNPARVVKLQSYNTKEQDDSAKYKYYKNGTKTEV